MLNRRNFLRRSLSAATGFAALGPAASLFAADPPKAELLQPTSRPVKTGQFVFPRLRFAVTDETSDLWNVHPIGDANLRFKLGQLTNINVSQEPRVVTLADFDDMAKNPFVFMTSEGHFKLTEQEEKNFKEYLDRGGFIMADDCVYKTKEDRFFKAYVDTINKLYPENPMRKIPYDHEIFHIYFDFKEGAPHCQGVPHGAYGLFEPGTGRIMTIVTPGDLHCGWVNQWFNPQKNEQCIQMGINTIIYFLTH
jgi:hypothetical protein